MSKIDDNRLQEFAYFYGWPIEQVRELAPVSKAFYECVWLGLNPKTPEEYRAYYDGPWYTLRQMAYPPKFCPNGKVRAVIDEMKSGQRFLDYGCGVGDSLIYAAEHGIEAYGVEVEGKRDFLWHRIGLRKLRPRPLVSSPEDAINDYFCEGYDDYFDRSVICATLDHCDDPITVAKFLCRVTKGNILCTPRIDEDYERPTHVKEILEQLPEAFAIIDEHNDNLRS